MLLKRCSFDVFIFPSRNWYFCVAVYDLVDDVSVWLWPNIFWDTLYIEKDKKMKIERKFES